MGSNDVEERLHSGILEKLSSPSGRELSAIMFTDMVGYTSLCQKNESLALELLSVLRGVVRSTLPKYNGVEIKSIGDGSLIEFASALHAVRCAFEIQQDLHEYNEGHVAQRRIFLRIGIHLGDVVRDNGDVYGDAVNIASRMEPLANPGGVCISEQVYQQVRNKFEFPLVSLGSRSLKNVEAGVIVYRLILPWEADEGKAGFKFDPKRIAVLPFANMSPDPNDEYFADGMMDEVVSTISRIEQVEIISRTSVMQYKKNPKPIKDVARELEVGTILEGSVRKAGNRVRVTVQAIDALRDRHIWVESYDKDLQDVFAIQSDIANQVASTLKVRMLPRNRTSLSKLLIANTEAYTLYLKGRYYWNERTREGIEKAILYYTCAIEIDPECARAYAGLADCYTILENWGYLSASEASPMTRKYSTKAQELDDSIPEAHATMGVVLFSGEFDPEGAEREFRRAIELNPSYATAYQWHANLLFGARGMFEEAIQELREAKRLDPLSSMISANLGDHLLAAGRYEEAENEYRSILEYDPDFAYAHSRVGLALLKQARYEEAITEIQKAISHDIISSTVDLIYGYSLMGRKDDAERLLAELEGRARKEFVSNFKLAQAYAAADLKDRAIEYLERAAAERSNELAQNINEPHLDRLHSDPRFQKLLTKIGIKRMDLLRSSS